MSREESSKNTIITTAEVGSGFGPDQQRSKNPQGIRNEVK